jgi:hypothetical protein
MKVKTESANVTKRGTKTPISAPEGEKETRKKSMTYVPMPTC